MIFSALSVTYHYTCVCIAKIICTFHAWPFFLFWWEGQKKNLKAIKKTSSCAFIAHWMLYFLFSNPFCIRNSVLLWSTIKDPFSASVMWLYFSPFLFSSHILPPFFLPFLQQEELSVLYQSKIFLGNHSIDFLKAWCCENAGRGSWKLILIF